MVLFSADRPHNLLNQKQLCAWCIMAIVSEICLLDLYPLTEDWTGREFSAADAAVIAILLDLNI